MMVLRGIDCPRAVEWRGDWSGAAMLAMMTPPPEDGWPQLDGTRTASDADPNSPTITAGGASIDQLLLERVPGLSGAPLASFQLGASRELWSGSPCDRAVSYSKSTVAPFSAPLYPEWQPGAAWQRLLASAPGASSVPAGTGALDRRLIELLAARGGELRPRLPTSQRPKLDGYLDSLRGLETHLGNCAEPELPALPTQGSPDATLDEIQHLEICRQQAAIIATAFRCDLTRVITFDYAHARSTLRFKNILPPGSIDYRGGYFDASKGLSDEALQAIDTFYARQTAALLLALKAIPEGDGTLLDNTLVVYLSGGSSYGSFFTQDMPVLLFGGKFLNLRGGRYLQFEHKYMTDFWVQTAQAWGYSALTEFGAKRWNTGSLPGLYG